VVEPILYASRSGVHGLICRGRVRAQKLEPMSVLPLLWAGFLTALVVGPWLSPGYLFGTDWPGPRRFDFLLAPSSSVPVGAVMASLSWIVGGEVTGKLFVIVILLTAGSLAYGTVLGGGFVPRAAAATIYLINPFVYGRLHYGQFFLLGAYAVFPLAASRFRLLMVEPRTVTALLAAAAFALVGMFSPHVLLIASLLAAAFLVTHLLAANKPDAKTRREYLRRLGSMLILAFGATLALSAYWLAPFVVGRGPEANAIAGTGAADLGAYAAVGDPSVGLLPNLLGLYGFWAEDSGRFTSMKAFVPAWPVVIGLILALASIGALAAIRRGSAKERTWVFGLVLAGAVAILLEMGISNPSTAPLVSWLDSHFVIYRGMRDAGKWAVLLAFVYSQLASLGAVAILAAVRTRFSDANGTGLFTGSAAALLLALPLYYGNGLLFGMHGEIKPSAYPAGWYAVDRFLVSDPHPGNTLALPWHEYMSYTFIRNQNRVVAAPAPSFFSVPIVVSNDPEVPGVVPPRSNLQEAISALVRSGSNGQWADVLMANHIKYIVLARDLDWSYFMFLDDQPGLTKVGDFGSIVLYRNELVS